MAGVDLPLDGESYAIASLAIFHLACDLETGQGQEFFLANLWWLSPSIVSGIYLGDSRHSCWVNKTGQVPLTVICLPPFSHLQNASSNKGSTHLIRLVRWTDRIQTLKCVTQRHAVTGLCITHVCLRDRPTRVKHFSFPLCFSFLLFGVSMVST